MPGGLVGAKQQKPDTKLDSPLFFALAKGIKQSAPVVEGAAIATAAVVAPLVVIDEVALTLDQLIALGTEALAKLIAAGKISGDVVQRLTAVAPQLMTHAGNLNCADDDPCFGCAQSSRNSATTIRLVWHCGPA